MDDYSRWFPTPEQAAARAAQRSVPASGVREVTEDISDDGLYAAFVEFLGGYGIAREVEPNVICLDIADDKYPRGLEPGQPLMVFMDRAQLRRQAWAADNIFDDTDWKVPATTEHVKVGFMTFTFSLEEEFEAGTGARAGVQPGNLVYDETADDLLYRPNHRMGPGTE